MAEMIARFKPGENVPVFASASQILAGRFVGVAGKDARGAYIGAHATAATAPFGVAEQDSAPTTFPAHATERMVNVCRRGAVAMVTAGAAIAAGAQVEVGTAGKAITLAAGVPAGRALTAAAGDGSIIEVDLY